MRQMQASALIQVCGLGKRFGGKTALDDLSFSLGAGEILGIVGPNGAGKSTAMKLFSGFLRPHAGAVRVCGFDMHRQARQARMQVGYLPEGAHCYASMRVRDFLRFIARIRGITGAHQRARIDEVVERLQLEPVQGHLIASLSRDQQRLLGLAQATLHVPRVLILDAPTAGLDPNQRQLVLELIKSHSRDTAVIVSSHLLEEVASLCSRVLVLARGKLQVDCPPLELRSHSRYQQAVTLVAEQALDLLALAVLPGVAGIESDERRPGTFIILAQPGRVIHAEIKQLIVRRNWCIQSLEVECGRLDEAFQWLTLGDRP